MSDGSRDQSVFAVYDETEEYYREHPSMGFAFIPIGLNANKPGRLVCFRRAARLPKEADAEALKLGVQQGGEGAWTPVIWLDRHCPKWLQWEPGVSPREQFAEERQRKFTLNLKDIETRLTWLAIKVAVVIGLLQLLLMTPDSAGWKLLSWLVRPFGWLRYW
jgi:hypothetical protein